MSLRRYFIRRNTKPRYYRHLLTPQWTDDITDCTWFEKRRQAEAVLFRGEAPEGAIEELVDEE